MKELENLEIVQLIFNLKDSSPSKSDLIDIIDMGLRLGDLEQAIKDFIESRD